MKPWRTFATFKPRGIHEQLALLQQWMARHGGCSRTPVVRNGTCTAGPRMNWRQMKRYVCVAGQAGGNIAALHRWAVLIWSWRRAHARGREARRRGYRRCVWDGSRAVGLAEGLKAMNVVWWTRGWRA